MKRLFCASFLLRVLLASLIPCISATRPYKEDVIIIVPI